MHMFPPHVSILCFAVSPAPKFSLIISFLYDTVKFVLAYSLVLVFLYGHMLIFNELHVGRLLAAHLTRQ